MRDASRCQSPVLVQHSILWVLSIIKLQIWCSTSPTSTTVPPPPPQVLVVWLFRSGLMNGWRRYRSRLSK